MSIRKLMPLPRDPFLGCARSPFQTKIVLAALAGIAGALISTFSLFEWQDWKADMAALQAQQASDARHLGYQARNALDAPALAPSVQAMFRADTEALAGAYFSPDGRVMRFGDAAFRLKPSWASAVHAKTGPGRMDLRIPITTPGLPTGEMALVADTHDVGADLVRNSLTAALLSLVATLLAVAGVSFLTRAALRPLRALDLGMQRVRETRTFTPLCEPGSKDEFARLTGNFNALLGDLQAYDLHLQNAMRDVTLAKDVAEEANVMKSQFLANMSHEIRTPLNGVLGMAKVMGLNALDKAQRERLEIVQESGEALLAILNDLLDISKIEAGQLDMEAAPFDITEVTAGVCSAFTPIANRKGLSFGFEVSDAARGRWQGDSVRIRQILYNLASNALKFTEQGGVRIDIDAVESDGGKMLKASVTDTGIGIPPDVLPKLFNNFVQADASISRRFGGTGLGLSICRHIAELMGGSITVQSEPGEGTRFDVLLPLPWLGPSQSQSSLPLLPEQPGDGHAGALSGLRILAAEDNPTNQLVLRALLHAMGGEPVIVDNGRLAVDYWKASPVDVVLMDVQMPVLNGIEATREIRSIEAERGLPPTPIVALSANAMKHQVAQYLEAGMDSHLAKPIQIENLYAVLCAIAQRCSAPSADAGSSRSPQRSTG